MNYSNQYDKEHLSRDLTWRIEIPFHFLLEWSVGSCNGKALNQYWILDNTLAVGAGSPIPGAAGTLYTAPSWTVIRVLNVNWFTNLNQLIKSKTVNIKTFTISSSLLQQHNSQQ